MRKLCLLLLFSLISFLYVHAQNVGINATGAAPHASAMLDVASTNQGLLIPRVALTGTNVAAPVSSPETSLLVYNTFTSAPGSFAVSPGFYTWDGAAWQRLTINSNSLLSPWVLGGNAGTNPALHFIGTTDLQPLVFKTNGALAGKVQDGGGFNTLYGYQAGAKITGSDNTALGYKALRDLIGGSGNTAVGTLTLLANEAGNNNTAIGSSALQRNTGSANTATGWEALSGNIGGTANTAYGSGALKTNSAGDANTATGTAALFNNTGNYNTAMGSNSLENNVGGNLNTALGYSTLYANTTGTGNTVIGANANTGAGDLNNATAIGAQAQADCSNCLVLGSVSGVNSAGSSVRVGIGVNSPDASSVLDLVSTTGGLLAPRMIQSERNAIASPATGLLIYQTDAGEGFYYYNGSTWTPLLGGGTGWALNGNAGTTPGTNFIGTTDAQSLVFKVNNTFAGSIGPLTSNHFFGYAAGISNTSGTGNTATGFKALTLNTTGSSNTATGLNALFTNEGGYENTATGRSALSLNINGYKNTAVGAFALTTNSGGYENTAVGRGALLNNTNGYKNTAVGFEALFTNATGHDNTAVGENTLRKNTTGEINTAIGESALYNNTIGVGNTAIGGEALFENINGILNTAAGFIALRKNTAGEGNSAFGSNTLDNNTTGSQNTAMGSFALRSTTQSSYNTAIGYLAGANKNNGWNNTFLGAETDAAFDDLYNTTAIGHKAIVYEPNSMRFGNDVVQKWGFGVRPGSYAALQVGTTASNGNWAYLSNGGTWTNASSVHFKEDFNTLDKEDLLKKISSLNISRWRYKGTDNEYHIGPIAEEFYALFKVGSNPQFLSTVDASGVALAGIQELARENEELKQLVNQLVKEMQQLKEKVEKGK